MEDIDEVIVDLLSWAVLQRVCIWIWTLHLKIWTHIWCPCALHLVHVIWQLCIGMGEYLTGYLGTSSENMNSYLMSMCTSSCSLSSDNYGGIYLTAYLGTSSENMNSTSEFTLASQRSFPQKTSKDNYRTTTTTWNGNNNNNNNTEWST